MDAPERSDLTIEISAADATDEDLDQMARQLLSEVRELDVESAELVRTGAAPAGTKTIDPVAIGTIAVSVLPDLLPKLVEGVQAWVMRGTNRTVKFKGKMGGEEIEFEGSGEDWQKLLAKIHTRRPKK